MVKINSKIRFLLVSTNVKNSKKKRIKRNPKLIMAGLAMMFVFLCELLFYTWCRVQCTHVRFDIAKQIEKANELSAMQDTLRIELARLKSPKRIAEIAREQLGLITPTPHQTIVLP